MHIIRPLRQKKSRSQHTISRFCSTSQNSVLSSTFLTTLFIYDARYCGETRYRGQLWIYISRYISICLGRDKSFITKFKPWKTSPWKLVPPFSHDFGEMRTHQQNAIIDCKDTDSRSLFPKRVIKVLTCFVF